MGEGNSNDGMHVLEYISSSCGLQITLCRRFQTTPFRGRVPAANARLLTYATPTLAPGTVISGPGILKTLLRVKDARKKKRGVSLQRGRLYLVPGIN